MEEEKSEKIIVRYCCAPECKSKTGYPDTSIHFHKFPLNETRRKQWIGAWKNWEPPKYGFVCSLHFTADSYKIQREDTNSARSTSRGDVVRSNLLKSDAIPTLWPNCPNYPSSYQSVPRTTANSSGMRCDEKEEKPPEENAEIFYGPPTPVELKLLNSIQELDDALCTETIPASATMISRGTKRKLEGFQRKSKQLKLPIRITHYLKVRHIFLFNESRLKRERGESN